MLKKTTIANGETLFHINFRFCQWGKTNSLVKQTVNELKHVFIDLNRGQAKTVLPGADQSNADNPKARLYIQRTKSTEVIQVRNDITGERSKPKGNPIKATNVKKHSGV